MGRRKTRHRLERALSLKPSGFSGSVTNTNLHDIVQLICISRSSCRMKVRSGPDAGFIFFSSGEIAHAEVQGTQGVEAFYKILSWETGAFVCDEIEPETHTIEESWDFLLMESMRRL